ncbi:hypothetical protein JCM3774_005205 [Rhodotorula dairenensis]
MRSGAVAAFSQHPLAASPSSLDSRDCAPADDGGARSPSPGPAAGGGGASAATRLPAEVLDMIFWLARPLAPPVLFKRLPVSPEWPAFARLALVHPSWRYSAQRALAHSVVLRSFAQIRKLTRALENHDLAGDILEIVLDMKELPRDGENDDGRDGWIAEPDGDHDESENDDATDLTRQSQEQQSLEPALLALLQLCGTKVKTVRCRGFGDACLANLTTGPLRTSLPHLEAFEYAPIDESAPPILPELCEAALTLDHLKHLAVRPCPRRLTRLAFPRSLERLGVTLVEVFATLHESDIVDPSLHQVGQRLGAEWFASFTETWTRTLSKDAVQATLDRVRAQQQQQQHGLLTDPKSATGDRTGNIAVRRMGHLESVSLQSVTISTFGLVSLLLPSLKTLTSLSLSSVLLSGSSVSALLTLACFAPNLTSFSLRECPRIDPEPTFGPLNPNPNNPNNARQPQQQQQQQPAGTPPLPVPGGAGRPAVIGWASSLTAEHFWALMRHLTRVESLSLLNAHVFADSPHRRSYRLPSGIRKLSLAGGSGTSARLEQDGIAWWLDRVEELHVNTEVSRSRSPTREGPEKRFALTDGAELDVADCREQVQVKPDEPQIKDVGGGSPAAIYDDDDEDESDVDDSDGSSTCSGGTVSTLDPERHPADFPLSAPSAASPSPLPSASQHPAAADPADSVHLPLALSTSTLSAAPASGSPPPSISRLVALTLSTRTSPRRLGKGTVGKSIHRRLDALEDAGTTVEWYGLQIVLMEALELTRELRVEMSEMPPAWATPTATAAAV